MKYLLQQTPLFFVVLLVAALSTGCATNRRYRLPPISADEVTVKHKDWFGSVEARATDVRVTEKYLTASTAEWDFSYAGWHDTVTAKNYRQRREDPEPETPAAPKP